MAESDHLLLESSNLKSEEQTNMVSVNGMEVAEGSDFTDQMFQQALEGVSDTVQQNMVQYTTETGESLTLIANGSVLTDVSGNVVGTLNDDGSTYTLFNNFTTQNPDESVPSDMIQTSNENVQAIDSTVNSTQETSGFINQSESQASTVTSLTTVPGIHGNLKSENSAMNSTNSQPLYVIRATGETQDTKLNVSSSSTQSQVTKAVSSGMKSSFPTTTGAPLGSSQNPIRIIQQGNHYTSTQQLNPDQLAQIMQVIQEQQAVRQAKQMGGPSVVYNPHTQTKIVYRVINPSDLHSKTAVNATPQKVIQSDKTYPGKKRGRKRKSEIKNEDEEDAVPGPELSRKQKEDKKKMRPKTRSGRISKPPKHMVKDYKQIHLVDWHEDYDDSDGGYSDYRGSDQEKGDAPVGNKKPRIEKQQEDAYENLRPKKFKCNECGKGYIGRTGLDRHWSKFPDHKGEEGSENFTMMDTEASNDSFVNSFISSSEATPGPGSVQHTPVNLADTVQIKPTRHIQAWRKNSKRHKLNELLERCDSELIAEVCLPKLANIVSPWEFLLMKVEIEQEEGSAIDFMEIHRLFEELRSKVKNAFNDCLDNTDDKPEKEEDSILKFTDEEAAKAMGTTIGSYKLKPLPVETLQNDNPYVFLSSNPTSKTQNQNHKRPTVVVSPSSMISPPLYKTKNQSKIISESSSKEADDEVRAVSESSSKDADEELANVDENSVEESVEQPKNDDTTRALENESEEGMDLNMECDNQIDESDTSTLAKFDTVVKQKKSSSDSASQVEGKAVLEVSINKLTKEIDKEVSQILETKTNINSHSVADLSSIEKEEPDKSLLQLVDESKSNAEIEVDEIINQLIDVSTGMIIKNTRIDCNDLSKTPPPGNLVTSVAENTGESTDENTINEVLSKETDNNFTDNCTDSVNVSSINSENISQNESVKSSDKNEPKENGYDVMSEDALCKEGTEKIMVESVENKTISIIQTSLILDSKESKDSVNADHNNSKVLPIVKLELPSPLKSANAHVKVVCNTDDLEEEFAPKPNTSTPPKTNDSSIAKAKEIKKIEPNVTVTLPSVNSVKSASTSILKSPGILNRLIKGSQDNQEHVTNSANNTGGSGDRSKPVKMYSNKVISLPSCRTVISKPNNEQSTSKLVKPPPGVRIVRLKSGSTPGSSSLSSNVSNSSASEMLKNIILKSPTKTVSSTSKVSPSRSLIKPTTSNLIKQQKTWLKSDVDGKKVLVLSSKATGVKKQVGNFLSNESVTVVQTPQQNVITTDTGFTSERKVSLQSSGAANNQVLQEQQGLGQVRLLSSVEQEIPSNSSDTYILNPDGSLTLNTAQYVTESGQVIDGNQQIISEANGNQQLMETSNEQLIIGSDGSQQNIMGKDENQHVIIGNDGNQQIITGSDGSHQIVTDADGNQQIIMTVDGNQQVVMGMNENQQVIMNEDGTHQIVMESDGSQQYVMDEDGNPQILMKTEESQQIVMGTQDDQHVLMGGDESQQIFMDADGNQVVFTSDVNSQVASLEDEKSQSLNSNDSQNSQVVFSSEFNPQVAMTSVDSNETTVQNIDASQTVQTEDGIYLVRNPDGTCQIHSNSDQPIPLETIQALMSMAPEQFQLSST